MSAAPPIRGEDAPGDGSCFLAIVNPAAGGGRCGRLAPIALDRVRSAGIEIDIVSRAAPARRQNCVRARTRKACGSFLAVGGDGTAYEIVNGLFPDALSGGRPVAGISAARHRQFIPERFHDRRRGAHNRALKNESRRACDVIRLRHSEGELYYLNLLSLGFPADVGELVNRRFKSWGELGYVAGVFVRLAGLEHMLVSAPSE